MADKNRESAVRNLAVGAAGDEPISNFDTAIVAHSETKINSNSHYYSKEFVRGRMFATINLSFHHITMSMNQQRITLYRCGLSEMYTEREGR